MRFLLTFILLAAVGWSGYWFIGASGSQAAFESWIEQRRDDGWVAEYNDLTVQGFPNRFDASFTGLSLADPETGLAWQAPFFQILALSYQPNSVIAIWPQEQMVATPQGKYQLASDDMRASLTLQPDTQLALERTTLTAENLVVTASSPPETAGIEALTLAAERAEGTEATYRLGLAASGVAPSAPWMETVDPGGKLPGTLQTLNADLTVTFDKPWDRAAIEIARPQPRRIDLRLAQARWGQLDLQLAGSVDVDEGGQPKGKITVKAKKLAGYSGSGRYLGRNSAGVGIDAGGCAWLDGRAFGQPEYAGYSARFPGRSDAAGAGADRPCACPDHPLIPRFTEALAATDRFSWAEPDIARTRTESRGA